MGGLGEKKEKGEISAIYLISRNRNIFKRELNAKSIQQY